VSAIRDASPKPDDAPSTTTRFGPLNDPPCPHLFDLLQHGGATAHGVAIAGNTTLDLGMNDHEGLSGASDGTEKRP
jgi:hypothetical protein